MKQTKARKKFLESVMMWKNVRIKRRQWNAQKKSAPEITGITPTNAPKIQSINQPLRDYKNKIRPIVDNYIL